MEDRGDRLLNEIKIWIINICAAVFFITAIEMILPNNSLKKYGRFVLGLILITVFINPIIKIFDNNYNINTYSSNAIKYLEDNKIQGDLEKYKEKNTNDTLNVFKLNLQNLCQSKIKETYPQNNYNVEAKVEYDKSKEKLIIKSINIEVKDGKIEKIKKVKIKDRSDPVNNSELINDEKSKAIKEMLSKDLNIPKECIKIYKS